MEQRLHIALDEIKALEDRVADLRGTLVERNDRCIELERRLVNQRSAQAQVLAELGKCSECGGDKEVPEEHGVPGDQTLIEYIPCPECGATGTRIGQELVQAEREKEAAEGELTEVLAGVREALKLRIGEHEAIARRPELEPWQEQSENLKANVLRDFLATLNPSDLGQTDANPKLGADPWVEVGGTSYRGPNEGEG